VQYWKGRREGRRERIEYDEVMGGPKGRMCNEMLYVQRIYL
jgi:hypothetical protein